MAAAAAAVAALAAVGALTVLAFLLDSLWSVLELAASYLTPYFLPAEEQTLAKRFGPWAAVTGSTDGIGREYARELARRGLSVVLISRSRDKLLRTARDIEAEHGVKTKIVVADFTQGPEVYAHVEKELENIPLGILVNNVGINYSYPMPLSALPARAAWDVVAVNAGAATALCRLVLPGMRARRRGAVVNVSSGSELLPLPLMAVYAATKAYMRSLTHALRAENAALGVTVQHLSPLFVSTKINAFSARLTRGGALVPDAATYARHAVASLGRVSDTTGYWLHGLQYTAIKLAPVWLRTRIGHYMNQDLRREYFRNQKAAAAE